MTRHIIYIDEAFLILSNILSILDNTLSSTTLDNMIVLDNTFPSLNKNRAQDSSNTYLTNDDTVLIMHNPFLAMNSRLLVLNNITITFSALYYTFLE